MASDTGEKKHDATPHRQEEYRKQGRFARARDASGLAATLGALAALAGSSEHALASLKVCFSRTHGDLGAIVRGDGSAVATFAASALFSVAGPAAIAAAIGGAVVGAAQAGIRIDVGMLGWKSENLDPLPRLKQLVSGKHAFIEISLAAVRIAVIGIIANRALREEIPGLLGLTAMPLAAGMHFAASMSLRLALQVLAGLVVLSIADYAQSRFTLNREMRMTTEELKEEQRSQDGDPKIKARQRARARALARRRMMLNVKKADVVVTNPTHIAVALRYQTNDPAPIVLAKGHDEVALTIRTEARKHGIPIVENRALARALDAEVPIGNAISGAHYAAVAHVLAFVYRLRSKRVVRGSTRA